MASSKNDAQFMPIGIDLGSDSVKVAQLVNSDIGIELAAADSVKLSDSISASIGDRLAEFTKALKSMIKDGQFHGKRAVLSIPAEWTFVHPVKIPKAGPEAMEAAVRAEVQERLPYSLDEAILRYVLAGDVYGDGDSRQEVIAISAKRSTVEAYAKAASKASLEVVGINIEPCAIVECFAHLFRRSADASRTVLFVDLGKNTTQAVFARGSKMVFARNLTIAGESMTQAAAETLGITLPEAKAIRMDILTGRDSAIGADSLYEAFAAGVNLLSDELMQCMRYYESVFPGFAVERAIFVGGQAYDHRLCQLIAKRLNLPAQIGDPMVKIQRHGGENGTNNPMPNWAVAVGLSLGFEAA